MVLKTYFQNLSLLILKRNTLNQLKNRVSPEHESFSCLANIIYTDVFQITTDECYIHYYY